MPKYVNMNGNSSHREVYHTNVDCKRLKNNNFREASENMVEWHELRLCEHCENGAAASNPYE